MIRIHKYRLYDSKKLRHLHQLADITGIIYNHCIALHKRYYRLYGKHLDMYTLQKHLTKLKKRPSHAFWNLLGSQAVQEVTERINEGYKKFFKYATGKTRVRSSPPTFKKVKRYKSFTLKGRVGYKLNGNILSLNGYDYTIALSRPVTGVIKRLIVKRDNRGRFFLCIVLEQADRTRAASGKSVGIDFGLKQFLTLSDGAEIDSPLFHLQNLPKLKRLSRELSRKKKGSNNREKARKNLSRLHDKIANQRDFYFHNLANRLVKEYDHIYIEDLNIAAMKQLWGRKVSDLAFSRFVEILSYKGDVRKVDRFFPSSKSCSSCGFVVEELPLKIRAWTCPSCGIAHQRDLNAAINIHRVGSSTLAGETVRPVL